MSLVQPGFAVLTNKAKAGTVAHDVAFSHTASPYSKATLGLELIVQAPEQIMINTPLWMNLKT